MKQLSALDAAFLGLENSTMTGNISSIMLLDPSGLDDEFDLAHITQFVAERLDRVIFFRSAWPRCRSASTGPTGSTTTTST